MGWVFGEILEMVGGVSQTWSSIDWVMDLAFVSRRTCGMEK